MVLGTVLGCILVDVQGDVAGVSVRVVSGANTGQGVDGFAAAGCSVPCDDTSKWKSPR